MTDFPPFRKILSVKAAPNYRLALSWANGRQAVVDLSDMIAQGGVFLALKDTEKFAAVRVGENGRLVEWPEPKDDLGYPVIEIDSSALLYKVEQQRDSNLLGQIKSAVENFGKKAPKFIIPSVKS